MGTDTFTYTAFDGNGGADEATVTVTVISIGNQPPRAFNDAAITPEATSVLIDILANDSDPNGDALTLASVSAPTSGSAVIEGDQIRYTPEAGFIGADAFLYTVDDGNGETSTAEVLVTVTPTGGTTYTWTAASGNGLWTTPANWNPQGVPSAGDVALLNAGEATLTSDVSLTAFVMNGSSYI